MDTSKSLQIAKQFIGKEVEIVIDRPKGSRHPKLGFLYEVNYGYVPNTIAPDGSGLDAYYLGKDEPLKVTKGIAMAIVHRLRDDDDKIVVFSKDVNMTDEEIEKAISFQEKYFEHRIIRNGN